MPSLDVNKLTRYYPHLMTLSTTLARLPLSLRDSRKKKKLYIVNSILGLHAPLHSRLLLLHRCITLISHYADTSTVSLTFPFPRMIKSDVSSTGIKTFLPLPLLPTLLPQQELVVQEVVQVGLLVVTLQEEDRSTVVKRKKPLALDRPEHSLISMMKMRLPFHW